MPSHTPNTRAVFFDFGGTLFSYRPFRERFDDLLRETARSHGSLAPAEELRRVYAQAGRPIHRAYNSRPSYLHRDLFGDTGEAFVRALGKDPRPELRAAFYRGQTEVARPLISPRPDARATLEGLRARGIHLGIVSNIDDDQFAELWSGCALDPWVDAKTTSEEARSCKPDPGIFQLALRKAGNPDAGACVFVGDSLFHDTGGARALGMTTVHIAEGGPTQESDPQPDHVIEQLSELLSLVDRG